MAKRLYIIDGHALIFKMYYAFYRHPMVNSKGMDTSILFGFTKYLLELIVRERPDNIAVAFDPPGGSFRNELYPEYKANRAETPQLVIDALEPLTSICRSLDVPVLMIKGYEADDVIGSMAKRAGREGYEVYMVSPDKDYGQLIDEHIRQYKPGRTGSENEIIGPKEICGKYNIIDPLQVIDMLAICGDAADNVPGVKGIGEVWAGKLISRYGSVENIYAHLGELSEKQAMMFEAAKGHIALSKRLVTIKTDIAIDIPTEATTLNIHYTPELADLFKEYEFLSLRKTVTAITGKETEVSDKSEKRGVIEFEKTSIVKLSTAVSIAGKCSFATETETQDIFSPIRRVTVATLSRDKILVADGKVSDFKAIMEDPTITKFAYGIKGQMNALAHAGITLGGKLRDIELMHYLLDPEKSHSLDILAQHYLGVSIIDDNAGKESLSLFDEPEANTADRGKGPEAAAIIGISKKVWNELQTNGLTGLYERIEEPLIGVLSRMERNGVKVDLDSLKEFADELRKEISEHEHSVREIAGDPGLNLSSPKQIGELLFEKLKLDPKAKKNSRSWATDEATLSALSDRSPVIQEILDYRAARKLLSTYIEPFGGYISRETGRVHTTFNQALTSTGRLSSSTPNLQNIPIRTERGRAIRKAFVAQDEGSVIMSADYSQIELRIMAHLCGDSHMIQAFNDGLDIHAATAAKIFGIPAEEVTSDQRRIAKTANFGIMYGISAFGLAQRLGTSRTEAQKTIDDYFESFPSIKSFISETLSKARDDGYVETLFGRRRYIRDINAGNANLRSVAERNAVNAPIQGTSADIIKIAMIHIDRKLRELKLRSKMVLQIHDELLFEVPETEIRTLMDIVPAEMEGVISLSVPLKVECKYGKNWLDAH